MNDLMAELQSLLSSKDGKSDWVNEGAGGWDYQLKRIRHSFSKKGTKAVEALEKHNRKLRELLDSNDKLDSMKSVRKDTAWANIFDCIRRHAKGLHTAIKDGWKCDCREPHIVALRLQQRTTGDWSSFNVSFEYPKNMRTIALTPHKRRELIVNVKLAGTQHNDQPNILLHPSVAEAGCKNLRRDFESKAYPGANIATRPILRPSSPSSSTISQTSFTGSVSSCQSQSHTSVSTNVAIEESHVKRLLSGLKLKAKKSVQIHDLYEPILPTSTVPTIELSIHATSAASPTPSILLSPPAKSLNDVKIDDLCKTVYKSSGISETYLGYLPDEHQNYHEFRCLDDNSASPAFHKEQFVSLETILSNTRPFPPLNRHERYKIACILASSLLQLQNAPWLASNLQKNKILFPCDWNAHKIMIDEPYLPYSFFSSKCQFKPLGHMPNENNTTTVKQSLHDLGIVLLELCFGQRIEEQAIRQNFLVDGKEHANTNYLTALDWADAVCEQEPALEHVIKCCMFCIFEEKANWDNPRFTQAVYASVVEPLEKIISSWASVS
ncbi:hypothetical protein SBOR_4314 [Sclerotinia borealis F-4128]|uniref:DUF7580 domain-containing protein n=1 Tax=Sclerotinia borealis (strain F-4128) TaxID=1432307 RepID=W9CEW3_SCLBF|nr:hypothetical protein SBOR_4314 [Sclerotinia borealis F-4128]